MAAGDLGTGLAVAIVGMLGTLLALSVLAGMVYVLYRLFPPTEGSS